MNKSTILANIASKIKSKVGLINKTQHGEVHEDIVNEVYSDFIKVNNANATKFARDNTYFDIAHMYVKKTGNEVTFSGFIEANGTLQGSAYPLINILDTDFHGFTDSPTPIDNYIFEFKTLRNGFVGRGFVQENKIYFTDYVTGTQSMTFEGHYYTKNL